MITRLKEILGGIEEISAWRIIDRGIRDLIHQSLYSARYVRTEHYPLVEPGSELVGIPESNFASRPLERWLSPHLKRCPVLITGDRLNLTLEPYLKNSLSSAPVDADGFALSSTKIVESGVLKRFWSPERFCRYLNVPPTD